MSDSKPLNVRIFIRSHDGAETEFRQPEPDPAEFQAYLEDLQARVEAEPSLVWRAVMAGQLASLLAKHDTLRGAW